MEFKDYSFYRQRYVEETGTTYFICTRYRSGCKARLIVRNNTVKARNEHTCCTHEEHFGVRWWSSHCSASDLRRPPTWCHRRPAIIPVGQIAEKTKWDAFCRYFRKTWMTRAFGTSTA
ncbi:hypothetical protein PC116_g27567 [Phytophthora cactorum]|nr:hypothetical protein PC116_g27567 [Phytophthora cactorum]